MTATRQLVECQACGATFDPNDHDGCPECGQGKRL